MQTQRDRVQAYQFLIGRMSSALTSGEPSPPEPPDRRHRFGLVLGIVLGVLVGAGFWVYGLIVPGGNNVWQEEGVIIVEKETGNRYLYVDGMLRPALNQASALLYQGTQARVERISRASMSGLPHGAPIGIPGAPDSVPTAADLVGGPWLLCLGGPPDQPPVTSMVLDPPAAPPVPDNRYVLVTSAGGVRYLVLDGVKYRVGGVNTLVALGVPAVSPPRAPDHWLDQLPDGPVLTAAQIPGAGKAGPPIAGRDTTVGEVFRQRAANGTEQHWVLRADGLAPMSPTEFALLATAPGVRSTEVDAAVVSAAPRSGDTSLMRRLPNLVAARLADGADSETVCLAQLPVGINVAGAVVIVPAERAGLPMLGSIGATVAPNAGMLAAAVPLAPGQEKPARYLITDRGIKYPVPDDDSVDALGYSGVPPIPVPDTVLAALPTGPTLSRAAVGVSEEG